jgi:hypothetical protein
MSPPDVRGTLVSLKEAMVMLGMLLGYFIGKLRTNSLLYVSSLVYFIPPICKESKQAHVSVWIVERNF